jgi:hypothetical protein
VSGAVSQWLDDELRDKRGRTDEAGEEELPVLGRYHLDILGIPPQPREHRLPRARLVAVPLDRDDGARRVDAHRRPVQVLELGERLAVHKRAEKQLVPVRHGVVRFPTPGKSRIEAAECVCLLVPRKG